MNRSLGTASSNPHPPTVGPPEHVALRDGEAAPNDLWITLAERQHTILRLRAERDARDEDITLLFDSHDQARLA